jgi:hypothetical protein
MEELQKQVRRAKRRLGTQRFVAALGWSCTVALSLAVIVILVGKFWPLGVADWVWPAAAVGLGTLAAAGWAVATGRGTMDAAIEIDHRFGLKERVSSTLALSEEERDSEAGQALTADAIRRVKRIDVAERMKISPGRPVLFPLFPAVLAFMVAFLISPAAVDNPAEAMTDPAAVKKQVQVSAKKLERQLAEQREKAKKQDLPDAEKVFKLLQEGAKELSAKTPEDQKKALVKLNDLAKQIAERREKAGGAEKIKEKLNQMKDFKPGPADQFAKAVKQGDFNKAMEELDKLKEQLSQGKLDEKQQKQLAEQMDQMKDKLQKMVEAQKEAQKDLEKKADEARKAGRNEEANKLEEQLDKLRQQMPQMKQLDQLAKQMQQCSKSLKDGQMKDAEAAMGQIQENLKDLQKQLDEMEMLDEAMDQMAQCRKGMNCKKCGGAGCEACQGGAGKGEKDGDGMGEGQGRGDRPEEKTNTAFRDSQVRQQVDKGSMSVAGYVDGPNKKGDVNEAIKEQMEAAKHQANDPLTGQRIPRKQRQHAKEYFDRLRKGE